MLPLLRAVELDLVVEHEGHQATVTGANGTFLVDFPTLASLTHFAMAAWRLSRHPLRPLGVTVSIAWRGLRWEVLHGTPSSL